MTELSSYPAFEALKELKNRKYREKGWESGAELPITLEAVERAEVILKSIDDEKVLELCKVLHTGFGEVILGWKFRDYELTVSFSDRIKDCVAYVNHSEIHKKLIKMSLNDARELITSNIALVFFGDTYFDV